MAKKNLCPCGSKKSYDECCAIFHAGKDPETALQLMRSRYSAYALNHVDYIVRTTHPRNPAIAQNLEAWKNQILHFCINTEFEKLEILDSKQQKEKAIVVFIAYLKQKENECTFTEKSYFAKVDGRWYYVNGDVFEGENRDVTA